MIEIEKFIQYGKISGILSKCIESAIDKAKADKNPLVNIDDITNDLLVRLQDAGLKELFIKNVVNKTVIDIMNSWLEKKVLNINSNIDSGAANDKSRK